MVMDSNDPLRQFSDSEKETLTRNLLKLTQLIGEIEKGTKYNIEFLCNLHDKFFSDVRDHAGRIRNKDYGEEYLTFGPNRSVAAKDVSKKLEEHFLIAQGLFGQLDSHEKNQQFVEEVIKVAAYLHADLIRIHPFRDGNGRVSRLIMNYVLRKYGFPLHTMNVPKQEYIECLNHYYKTKDIEPLCDLMLRIYYNQFNQ